ncbi:MAG: hypothetical protein IAE97_05755 [Chthoniobacterales bacterium]|nr:hypothetical protein [Chthoniobacterales bacterium]
MKAPVFQSCGLDLVCGKLPEIRVAGGGDAAVWPVHNDHHAAEALDAVTGLAPVPPNAVVWFGTDFAGLDLERCFGLLRRIAPLTEDGALLGNINVCENILLPSMQRRRGSAPLAELEKLVSEPPWSGWLPFESLLFLPHMLDDPRRAFAGLLRAYLCRPEAIVAANIFGKLDARERPALEAAVAWVRGRLPDCSWLFISPESALPRGFGESILKNPAS